MNPFTTAQWIWTQDTRRNPYTIFVKAIPLPEPGSPVRVRITASYHYELYLNGDFIARGPVHGDPQWCQYDVLTYEAAETRDTLHIAILVHHASDTHLHYLLPAPGGVCAEFEVGDAVTGTDASWKCHTLEMWREDVPPRGWALDYCEDYDAALEPEGWADKIFPSQVMAAWENAVLVPNPDTIWTGYQARGTPYLERRFIAPVAFKTFRAPDAGAEDVGAISAYCDREPLISVSAMQPFDVAPLNANLADANAVTFDLGRERIGFYDLDIEAPEGTLIELSGAELLNEGRPWIHRKNTRYSVRYRTRAGRQRFTSFGWNGFRYLHLVIRGSTQGVRIHQVGCLERKAPLTYTGTFQTGDTTLQRIFDLCRYTLEVGAQEHLIDCPTREQTQYWGDALFIAESLWRGFDEPAYLAWYLEGFLHVPFKPNEQISSTYPGEHITLLDYSLIPLLGQPLYRAHTGKYYKPAETFAKALRLKHWYDAHLNADGLVAFDYQAYADQDLRNFIDHPGIGWHNFPHPGIERDGISCPLNSFFYGFVRTLSDIAAALGDDDAPKLRAQAARLADAIRRTFYDGAVFHDAAKDGTLSAGTAWQTNALAVYFDLIQGQDAKRAMRAMLDGYDTLCRCSPYFHFYFLPALRKAGLAQEAVALIKREWRQMLDGDATTTWESFGGDEKDSLCHPWSTAPFLFLLAS